MGLVTATWRRTGPTGTATPATAPPSPAPPARDAQSGGLGLGNTLHAQPPRTGKVALHDAVWVGQAVAGVPCPGKHVIRVHERQAGGAPATAEPPRPDAHPTR